jgi:hypothetical protein
MNPVRRATDNDQPGWDNYVLSNPDAGPLGATSVKKAFLDKCHDLAQNIGASRIELRCPNDEAELFEGSGLHAHNSSTKFECHYPCLAHQRRYGKALNAEEIHLLATDAHRRTQTFCSIDMAGQKQYAPKGRRQFIRWCVHQQIRFFCLCGSVWVERA